MDRLSNYDYDLPAERIAERPSARRDESALMVLPRGGGAREHRRFRDLVDLMSPGDLLVLNESKVLPARLLGRKPSGAAAEVLLIRPLPTTKSSGVGVATTDDSGALSGVGVDATDDSGAVRAFAPGATDDSGAVRGVGDATEWEALVRPGGKLKPGRVVDVAEDLRIEIVDSAPGGGRRVRVVTPLSVAEALSRHGHMPLPPYIDRSDDADDRERYQTVYARTAGSVAAPTAGLHFTPDLLARLEARGVRRTAISLHVGVGTFRPVETDDPANHEMHAEVYHVPEAASRAVAEARARGGRVWAVGTTVVRTLESVATADGRVPPGSGSTDLFIRPPFSFRVVDGLITNFHLPRSTLLMLVSAFAGRDATLEAYRDAVARGYRFYSYGDAMAVTPNAAPQPQHDDGSNA